MKIYADTSFMVKLLNQENDSPAAATLYRSLGRPSLLFLPIHNLEVTNAIRQRAFHLRPTLPARARTGINHERDMALGRLRTLLSRRLFLPTYSDVDAAIERAQVLSERNIQRGSAAVASTSSMSPLPLTSERDYSSLQMSSKVNSPPLKN